jgi:tRNA G18 (ribose-2'-O)-methylase SpoU
MRQLRKKEIKKFFKDNTNKREQQIYVIVENVEYARNVAQIFRTADAAGVRRLYLTGISHLPPFGKDLVKVSRHKEKSVEWQATTSLEAIKELKKQGFVIIAIEITDNAVALPELAELAAQHHKICLVVGSEVYGVVNKTLAECDHAVFIPMYGKGASLNVSHSLAIALFSF